MELDAAEISAAAGQTRSILSGNRPGLARLLASTLHWGLAAGLTDSLMVAAVKLWIFCFLMLDIGYILLKYA